MSESVAEGRELLLPGWAQHLVDGLLYHPVQDCGDAQLANPAAGFGDFHPPGQLRAVFAVQEFRFDAFPMKGQVTTEACRLHAVHARCAFVAEYRVIGPCLALHGSGISTGRYYGRC